jgi:hypothetical protein
MPVIPAVGRLRQEDGEPVIQDEILSQKTKKNSKP